MRGAIALYKADVVVALISGSVGIVGFVGNAIATRQKGYALRVADGCAPPYCKAKCTTRCGAVWSFADGSITYRYTAAVAYGTTIEPGVARRGSCPAFHIADRSLPHIGGRPASTEVSIHEVLARDINLSHCSHCGEQYSP